MFLIEPVPDWVTCAMAPVDAKTEAARVKTDAAKGIIFTTRLQ